MNTFSEDLPTLALVEGSSSGQDQAKRYRGTSHRGLLLQSTEGQELENKTNQEAADTSCLFNLCKQSRESLTKMYGLWDWGCELL